MIQRILSGMLLLCTCFLFSCKSGASADEGAEDAGEVKTPVTITTVRRQSLSDNIRLEAVSAFMISGVVKSAVNGYIQQEMVAPGQEVSAGQLLFVLKTREAAAIGSGPEGSSGSGSQPDSIPGFNGMVRIRAAQSGYISQVYHRQGDYVQDGEQLCIIADGGSFAFVLQVPFEQSPYIKAGKSCTVLLPDSEQLDGKIISGMPVVDLVSQTQRYIVKLNSAKQLPENLVATVIITKAVKPDAMVLPKTALLTDETQSQWWVMKMINDSTAVKVPVRKGMESGDKVEILSPLFAPSDKILTAGNYGLPDTALVSVEK